MLVLGLTASGALLLLAGFVVAGSLGGDDPDREAANPPASAENRGDAGVGERKEEGAEGQGEVTGAVPGAVREFDAAALHDRLAGISGSYPGRSGIVVLDPASGKGVTLGADEEFVAASIGKLPTLMTLYRMSKRGELSLDDPITMLEQDVMSYGTGVLHTYPVGHTITLRECGFLMINESDNTAWEMLERHLGMDTIQAELYDAGIRSTDYAWGTTTAEDVLKMLQKISDPAFTDANLSREMLDPMFDTNLEDRLPAPLPADKTRVAHKSGSYGSSFGDAGIVYYKDANGVERHYFVVVLTDGMGEGVAREEMNEVSRAAYEAIAVQRDELPGPWARDLP